MRMTVEQDSVGVLIHKVYEVSGLCRTPVTEDGIFSCESRVAAVLNATLQIIINVGMDEHKAPLVLVCFKGYTQP
jgi:hypothetical protein